MRRTIKCVASQGWISGHISVNIRLFFTFIYCTIKIKCLKYVGALKPNTYYYYKCLHAIKTYIK